MRTKFAINLESLVWREVHHGSSVTNNVCDCLVCLDDQMRAIIDDYLFQIIGWLKNICGTTCKYRNMHMRQYILTMEKSLMFYIPIIYLSDILFNKFQ
jgi:hypothetical protein